MEAMNRHHLYWPRRAYQTSLGKRFRNLPCHVIRMLITDHNTIHATTQPPPKPTNAEMAEAINIHRQRRCPTCHGEANAGTAMG